MTDDADLAWIVREAAQPFRELAERLVTVIEDQRRRLEVLELEVLHQRPTPAQASARASGHRGGSDRGRSARRSVCRT